MRNLTLGDMDLGLENLHGKRKTDLLLSATGKLYAPMLSKRHAAILALPEALRRRPLAAELDQTDNDHDGAGTAIFSYIEAVLAMPGLEDATRAAATKIRETFIPQKRNLMDSYAEQAAAAKKNRLKLPELEADLKKFPVPGGKTLYDWVVTFLDAGDQLDALLDERSLVGVGGKEHAGKLRGETLGLLYQFRSTLKTEIAHDETLPRDLEGRVFSYLDELSNRRRPGKASGPQGGGGGEGSVEDGG